MIDGLYRVSTNTLCAGFVIKDGKVTLCAPILRKKINYWRRQAVLVSGDERPPTESQVHDQLAIQGLSLDERNVWWKTYLPELNRTPADMWSSDPKAVLLCAKYGCIGDRQRRTILTPGKLWDSSEEAPVLQEGAGGVVVHSSHYGGAAGPIFDSGPNEPVAEREPEPEPVLEEPKGAEPARAAESDPFFEGLHDQVLAERESGVPDWWK